MRYFGKNKKIIISLNYNSVSVDAQKLEKNRANTVNTYTQLTLKSNKNHDRKSISTTRANQKLWNLFKIYSYDFSFFFFINQLKISSVFGRFYFYRILKTIRTIIYTGLPFFAACFRKKISIFFTAIVHFPTKFYTRLNKYGYQRSAPTSQRSHLVSRAQAKTERTHFPECSLHAHLRYYNY